MSSVVEYSLANTMKDKKVITMRLVRATDLRQFRSAAGPRKMRMPYWVKGANVLSFEFINEHTSSEELAYLVKEGKVWIREEDGD